MKHIVVLGAGMVGSTIAADLCREYRVTSVDASRERVEALAAEHPLTGEVADLSRAEVVQSVVRNADLVIGAVPGFMGFATLQAIIEAEKDVVDISFFGEDPFELDALAKAHGVTAVVDCGVAPGLSNMVLGYTRRAWRWNRSAAWWAGCRRCGRGRGSTRRLLADRCAGGVYPAGAAGGARHDRHPPRLVGAGVGGDRADRHAGGVQHRRTALAAGHHAPGAEHGREDAALSRSHRPRPRPARERIPEPGADHRGRRPGAADRRDRCVTFSAVALGAR